MKKEKSCGAIILKEENENIETLILKHKNGGHWAFAKGHVEGNETEEETALREIKEETNLDVELDMNFRTSVTYSPSEGIEKDVIYFIAYKTEGEEIAQEEEIYEEKWCSIDEAINTVTYENDKEILRKVKEYLNI